MVETRRAFWAAGAPAISPSVLTRLVFLDNLVDVPNKEKKLLLINLVDAAVDTRAAATAAN